MIEIRRIKTKNASSLAVKIYDLFWIEGEDGEFKQISQKEFSFGDESRWSLLSADKKLSIMRLLQRYILIHKGVIEDLEKDLFFMITNTFQYDKDIYRES